jgi:CelD/BcsL family acetyltransferase involved in cellulose biosynthesis
LFAEFPGKVTFRCYRTPQELLEFHPLARTVSVKTYQERLLKSGLPDTPEFKAEMRDLASRDSVRAFLLFVEEKPIAYLCCPAEGSVLFYGRLGYDTNYSKYSPGSVLQYLAFEELFREKRFGIFDFTEGEGQQKHLFCTHEVECADLYVLACRPANVALVLLHAALGLFSRTALFFAERVGVKRKIKAAFKK